MDVEKYLSGFFKGTKNPSLKAMGFFMDEFNHPEKDLKVIHIAGTNGKGSCTEMMTNILIKSGFRVGKFISPHLIEYNERISVNHENISNKDMESLIQKIEPKIQKYNSQNDTKVTLFELETTMALLYFKEKKCDFVVLEVGLGGLYDCTNIVPNPLVSIISSVGYDHMHILGKTLPEIAIQKAGIIKENSETIFPKSDDEEINKIIINTCNSKNNKLTLIDLKDVKNYSYDKEFQKFDYKNFKNVVINLKGKKQVLNACICLECSRILQEKGYKIKENDIKEGLKTVVHKARFETLSKFPLVIYDGAHNEPAIKNFKESVKMYYDKESKVYIVSILKTKDYKTVLKILLEDKNASFIFTSGNDEDRYVSKDELLKFAKEISDNKNLYSKDLNEALEFACQNYKNSVIFVVGSFYIYGDVVRFFDK